MPNTDYVTRPVYERDAFAVASHRFHEPWGDPAHLSALRASYAEWVEGMMANQRYVGRVAECDGAVVAGAGAVLLDWGATWVDPEPVKARLANVFTLAEHRRRGLARQLVSETMQALRERAVCSITLSSTDSAAGLYISLGFEIRPGEFRILLS